MTREKYAFYIIIILSLITLEYYSVNSPPIYLTLFFSFLVISKLRINNCGLPSYYLIILIIPILNLFFLLKLFSMKSYPYAHRHEKIKNEILDGKMYKIN